MNSASKWGRSILRACLVAGTIAVVAPACGGGQSGPATPAGPRTWGKAPDVAMALKFTYVGKGGKVFKDSVIAELTSVLSDAGYTVVADKKKAQVIANVKIRATEKKSFLQMQVNGQRQVNYNVTVDATFMALGDSSLVDKTTTSFESDDGNANTSALEELIAQANKRGKLHKLAKKLEQDKKDAAQAKKDKEEKLWKASNAEGCAKGTKSRTACDGVKKYLKKYPDGEHAADARKAIEEGKAARKAAAEEEAWAAADYEKCAKPKKGSDCSGVEIYLKQYPKGAHAGEAKDIIEKSEKKIAVLKKRDAAKKKREGYKECIKRCKRRFIDYRPGVFEILVNRCIQSDCS